MYLGAGEPGPAVVLRLGFPKVWEAGAPQGGPLGYWGGGFGFSLWLLPPGAGSSKSPTTQRLCASRSVELPRRTSTLWGEVSGAWQTGAFWEMGLHVG